MLFEHGEQPRGLRLGVFQQAGDYERQGVEPLQKPCWTICNPLVAYLRKGLEVWLTVIPKGPLLYTYSIAGVRFICQITARNIRVTWRNADKCPT